MNIFSGRETLTIPPAGGAIFEITSPEEGSYPIVTHFMANALSGAIGVIETSKNSDQKPDLMS